jgi:hypothetical protein
MDQQDIEEIKQKADKYTGEYLARAKVIAKENKLWPTATLLIGLIDKLVYFENVLLIARQKVEEVKLRQQEDIEDSGLNLQIKEEEDDASNTGEV